MSVPLPRVLCRGFLSSTGVRIRCMDPVIHQGGIGGKQESGQCSLCMAHQVRANEMRWQREGRRLLRDRAKGYGAPAEGVDVWAGFREGA